MTAITVVAPKSLSSLLSFASVGAPAALFFERSSRTPTEESA